MHPLLTLAEQMRRRDSTQQNCSTSRRITWNPPTYLVHPSNTTVYCSLGRVAITEYTSEKSQGDLANMHLINSPRRRGIRHTLAKLKQYVRRDARRPYIFSPRVLFSYVSNPI